VQIIFLVVQFFSYQTGKVLKNHYLLFLRNIDNGYTTKKIILVYYEFHYIFNEFGHFYHGESGQPPNERGLVARQWIGPLVLSETRLPNHFTC
jgi:hypothetical protein